MQVDHLFLMDFRYLKFVELEVFFQFLEFILTFVNSATNFIVEVLFFQFLIGS